MNSTRIAKARITALPRALGDPLPEVWVVLDGAAGEQLLFSFYPDEIQLQADELVGLTLEEARRLKARKDRDYLCT
jgi:hypothetical protein